MGQGRENAKQFLRDNPHLAEEISKKVLASHTLGRACFLGNGESSDGDTDSSD